MIGFVVLLTLSLPLLLSPHSSLLSLFFLLLEIDYGHGTRHGANGRTDGRTYGRADGRTDGPRYYLSFSLPPSPFNICLTPLLLISSFPLLSFLLSSCRNGIPHDGTRRDGPDGRHGTNGRPWGHDGPQWHGWSWYVTFLFFSSFLLLFYFIILLFYYFIIFCFLFSYCFVRNDGSEWHGWAWWNGRHGWSR